MHLSATGGSADAVMDTRFVAVSKGVKYAREGTGTSSFATGDRVGELADALDLDLDRIAGLQGGGLARRASINRIARFKRHEA